MEQAERLRILEKLEAGDIFHGTSKSKASLICLVLKTDDTYITARRITTQNVLVFDKATGTSAPNDAHSGGTIDSVEPLPMEIHLIFVALDRRYRLGKNREESLRLRKEEQDALVFVADFYEKYPI